MTRFEPGDAVSFTHEKDWIIGEVEEIRQGHAGDDVLVVRQGGPWSGSRYVVLSSYVEKVSNGNHDAHFHSKHRLDKMVSIGPELISGNAFQGDITPLLN